VNIVHLMWDVMVGLGTLFALMSVWYALSWVFRRDMPRSRWFLRIAAACGVLSVIAMEAGWIVTEVGRQPWIVYNLMKVSDAATKNTGVWVTFIGVALVYIVVAVTTILVLRIMSRRFRAAEQRDDDVPYGPRHEPALAAPDGET
jgi:cytochrome d ubiquinol oxidase subunit I